MIVGVIAFWGVGFVTLVLAYPVGPAIGIASMLTVWVSMGVIATYFSHCLGFVVGELIGLGLVLLVHGLCAGWFK
jgi:hypothetical protein